MLSLTPDVRFIAVYLYTNDHIGLLEFYKIPLQFIQLETGYDISTIKIVLDKLQELEIIKHFNYLWVKLLRNDFASLLYLGEKNEIAVEKYLSEIPLEIKDYFKLDTTMDTTMDTNDKSEIINHKSKIINKKPEIINQLPDWLNKEVWSNWTEYRKEKKQRLTSRSIVLQLKELEKNKETHKEIIEQSIKNGWTGLFPLRETANKQSNILKVKDNKYENIK